MRSWRWWRIRPSAVWVLPTTICICHHQKSSTALHQLQWACKPGITPRPTMRRWWDSHTDLKSTTEPATSYFFIELAPAQLRDTLPDFLASVEVSTISCNVIEWLLNPLSPLQASLRRQTAEGLTMLEHVCAYIPVQSLTIAAMWKSGEIFVIVIIDMTTTNSLWI